MDWIELLKVVGFGFVIYIAMVGIGSIPPKDDWQ